jgi:hypothetical protein
MLVMGSKIHISIKNTNVGVENGRGLVYGIYIMVLFK